MPHISRIKLEKDTERKLIKTLELVMAKITKAEEMRGFLLSLLTTTERLMLAKRLAIIILLKEGLTESDISRRLHVTRITVSRMQLFLEARGEGYEVALKVLSNEKLLNAIKSMLIELTAYSIRAAGGRVKL